MRRYIVLSLVLLSPAFPVFATIASKYKDPVTNKLYVLIDPHRTASYAELEVECRGLGWEYSIPSVRPFSGLHNSLWEKAVLSLLGSQLGQALPELTIEYDTRVKGFWTKEIAGPVYFKDSATGEKICVNMFQWAGEKKEPNKAVEKPGVFWDPQYCDSLPNTKLSIICEKKADFDD